MKANRSIDGFYVSAMRLYGTFVDYVSLCRQLLRRSSKRRDFNLRSKH